MAEEPIILGINGAYHESSAALVRGNRVIAFVEEERLNRRKHAKPATIETADQLPEMAIAHCLETTDVRWDEVTAVAYSFSPELRTPTPEKWLTPNSWGTTEGDASFLAAVRRAPSRLSELAGRDLSGGFHWVAHEQAHASSAFYPSGYTEAAVLSLDGIGESTTGLLAHGRGDTLETLKHIDYPHSLGFLWEKMACFLGFEEYDAAKIMALAAFADAETYADEFASLVEVRDGGFTIDYDTLRFRTDDYGPLEAMFGPRRDSSRHVNSRDAAVAASLQAVTERVVLSLARWLSANTGTDRLCLAGGVALNCVANGKVASAGIFEQVYVQPLANDAGTSLGAALHVAHSMLDVGAPRAIATPYLGPDFSDDEQLYALKNSGFEVLAPADVPQAVAELLSSGRIGGWFQGPAEVGPRALGARSIVADPRRPGSRELINLRMKHREFFRPFAPSVLTEAADEWFELPGESPSQSFMSFAFSVKENKRPQVPAILHVDGTSRLQRVSRDLNPRYHAMISAFRDLTGVPLVLNTSFNSFDEPIVSTPHEAVRTFMRTGMDFLAMGRYLICRPTLGAGGHLRNEIR